MPRGAFRRCPREALRAVVPALAETALAHLAYVLASGGGVLGYLPGYQHEEGYELGGVCRFAQLLLVLPTMRRSLSQPP
ncbi:hypothetical protein [Actinacidiphila bryophytorum]|uniref:Uncharacterized protein n=1 Tax=Actinacidiphila bryophytorum TaxID=1436133 RepID=A0A9W4H5X4_9ACTN|nr:hypothetical protein [Actinacidiphila bryophytorum]MBM9439603.1 hypothetical protein [Actinacidiphila bryophytorum]MBN6543739.1 hypothetical protein [Actinacidiphila bryophytorum]CAG7653350.1 hypothetical protein SBRY_60116 [Actinacidiphila bryophytorum]